MHILSCCPPSNDSTQFRISPFPQCLSWHSKSGNIKLSIIINDIIFLPFLNNLVPAYNQITAIGTQVVFPSLLIMLTISSLTFAIFRWIIKHNIIATIKLSDFPASKRLLEDFLKPAVVPPLDASFRTARKHLLHFPPVFSMLENRFANHKVLFIAEFLSGYAGAKVVQVSLPNLFGCEFLIIEKVLGIFELMSFHFSPYISTYEETSS